MDIQEWAPGVKIFASHIYAHKKASTIKQPSRQNDSASWYQPTFVSGNPCPSLMGMSATVADVEAMYRPKNMRCHLPSLL